jgi:hypothetical protein
MLGLIAWFCFRYGRRTAKSTDESQFEKAELEAAQSKAADEYQRKRRAEELKASVHPREIDGNARYELRIIMGLGLNWRTTVLWVQKWDEQSDTTGKRALLSSSIEIMGSILDANLRASQSNDKTQLLTKQHPPLFNIYTIPKFPTFPTL